ncbi:hypothetical protein LTS15_006289 [Exophiala xenobiotica]|nr:hypothetical protein LTS15_006289 [Exophiala xenobiotica]
MGLDNTTSLSAAELAIYLILIPLTVWLFFKHGRRASLAYIYLIIFETLRLVAAGLQIHAHSQHTTSKTGAIIDSVGLSPLLLAFSGFLYELSSYYYSPPGRSSNRFIVLEEVLVHVGAYTGIALAALGASNLTKSNPTQSNIDQAHTLQETGVVLLLLTWIVLVYMCFRLCRALGQRLQPGAVLPILLLAIACIFVGVRSVYSVVYAFDHSTSVNPITGGFAIKLVLVFLVQLIAVVALLSVGYFTRNIATEYGTRRTGTYARPEDVEGGTAIPLRSPK